MAKLFYILIFNFLLSSFIFGAESEMPNVVIIYADDVGFGDVGVYGSKLIPTPNLDELTANGLVFKDGHCSAATCTPSRYSLLTGVYGFRDNVNILPPNAPLSIPVDSYTLADVFKSADYQTAVIGKWHLGLGEKGVKTNWNKEVKPGPLEIGFDYSYLLPSTNDRVPCVYLENYHVVNLDPEDPIYVGRTKKEVVHKGSTVYPDAKVNREAMTYYPSTHGHDNSVINGIGRIGYMSGGESALWNDETMADEFVNKAKEYIAKHKDAPFFLYFASQDIHVPRAPHPRFQGATTLGKRGDAMVQLDWTVGEIVKTLQEKDLIENTIIIFSSDNGPVYDDGYADGTQVKKSMKEVDQGHDGSGIYRGGKYQIYEGGARVPFIVSWPKRIQPGVSHALVNQIDLLASFAELLEVELPEDAARDSRNNLSAFLGQDMRGLTYMVKEAPSQLSLTQEGFKYIISKKNKAAEELYDLENDPSEKNNIILEYPQKASNMKALLTQIIKSERIDNF